MTDSDLQKLDHLLQTIKPHLLYKACPLPKDNTVSYGLECLNTIIGLSGDSKVKSMIHLFVKESLVERLNSACSVYMFNKDCLSSGGTDHLPQSYSNNSEFKGIESFRIAPKEMVQLELMKDYLGYSSKQLQDLVHEHFTNRRMRELLMTCANNTTNYQMYLGSPSGTFPGINGLTGYLDTVYVSVSEKNNPPRKIRGRIGEVLIGLGIDTEKVILPLDEINQTGLQVVNLAELIDHFDSFKSIQKYKQHGWYFKTQSHVQTTQSIIQYLNSRGIILPYSKMGELLFRVSKLPEITPDYDSNGRYLGEQNLSPHLACAKKLLSSAEVVLDVLNEEHDKAKAKWDIEMNSFAKYVKTLDASNRVNE